MAEVLQWVEDCFCALLGLGFFLTPGVVFWLALIGVVVIFQRISHTDLYQIVHDTIRESLRPFTQKLDGKTE